MGKDRLYEHIEVNIDKAKEIFKEFKEKHEVQDIELITEGMSTTNYIVTLSENKKYLLKIYPKNSCNIEKEIESYAYAEKSTKVPQILFYDCTMKIIEYDYLIMEYINGKTLKDFLLDNKGFNEGMMYSIGRNLAMLHRKEYPKRGLINEKLEIKEEFPTILSSFERVLEEFAGSHIGEDVKRETKEYINRNRGLMKNIDGYYVYTHGDFNLSNILVDEEHKIYFIDFEYSLSESPYLDIGKFFRSRGETDLYMNERAKSEFIDGYRSVANNKIQSSWEKLATIRDLLSMLGFINSKNPPESWIQSIKAEVQRVISEV